MEDDTSSTHVGLGTHSHHLQQILNDSSEGISRSTSPGTGWDSSEGGNRQEKRYRPRTYPYFSLLPYSVEAESERNMALQEILKQLYIAVNAEDFSPGALHWTRELKGWLSLKFEITRELRITLVKLYYMLSMAPGIDTSSSERFAAMFMVLLKKKHYLKPGKDLILDWRPVWRELKILVLPGECPMKQSSRAKLSTKTLLKFCTVAQTYFDPSERHAIFEEILPYFSMSDTSGAFIVVGLLNVLMPLGQASPTIAQLYPSDYLPTIFHMWSLVNRSKFFDTALMDIFSRIARDTLTAPATPFTEYGVFSKDQSDLIFTAILRLTAVPVGQASSPYSSVIDTSSPGYALYLERDKKKQPVALSIARWIVMSLSPTCLNSPTSILHSLEGLFESIDTFFHPSNQGSWTTMLSQLVFHLVDFFVIRWNREQSGELDTPRERRLNVEIRKRFVSCLKEITFMGIFAKSNKSVSYYLSVLQGLSSLEPDIMLPGSLQRFYPSLQGLVEVHRTSSSLCGLRMIANIMSKRKGYRCHITALLALALPGIDANDLDKTMQTLAFYQAVAYCIPFVDLTKGKKVYAVRDTSLAMQWVQNEMERMEMIGANVTIDYQTELSDEEEANILRSSTAGFGEFINALLVKIFTLLENLPDAAKVRTGSPEENVINQLPASLTPLFSTLSPELFDIVLEKLASYVARNVIHQARDAMAYMVNCLCKANPEKTLKRFVPMLIIAIRNEIDHNGAASDRSSGTDVLPRDRGLVWNVSILSMLVVHVGSVVLDHKQELFDIVVYMQEKCQGIPTVHISNLIHHLILNLTTIYPVDTALYEPTVIARGLDVDDWGQSTAPHDLTIQWHTPLPEEITFAIELFEAQIGSAVSRLNALIGNDSPVSRTGKNKIWSDDVARYLTQLRLVMSGMSSLIDPSPALIMDSDHPIDMTDCTGAIIGATNDTMNDDEDHILTEGGDEESRPQFKYQAGHLLTAGDADFVKIHELRNEGGELLSRMHVFLTAHQEDDVPCFIALYSAYKAWILDVGTERSAHTLDRITKLYATDIAPFKISGLRKSYPRPLLVQRANVYHQQRMRHNASARPLSDLDRRLLVQLAESCLSVYTEVRRHAQAALDSGLKMLFGGRSLVLPLLLSSYERALDDNELDKVKGAMYTLIFGSLLKTISRDWRFAPQLVKCYFRSAAVDKPSIQRLCNGAMYPFMDFGRVIERMTIIDTQVLSSIQPSEAVDVLVNKRHDFIVSRRVAVEERKKILARELIDNIKTLHWKIITPCLLFIANLSLRFETIAPESLIDIFATGAIDPHPSLRTRYAGGLTTIFNMLEARAAYNHKYQNFLTEKDDNFNKIEVIVDKSDPQWTSKYLDGFASPDPPEYFVDRDFPGWLVWGKSFQAHDAKPEKFTGYDELEDRFRQQIGKHITREWYRQFFAYLKQEPKDESADRFRMQLVVLLVHTFDLMHSGLTDVNLDDIKQEIAIVFGDGSDKHQHRATAEIIGALMAGCMDDPIEQKQKVWDFTVPFVLQVIDNGLSPENITYWMTCLHLITNGKDIRRSRQLVDRLMAFRLDMSSNAAFKESSKIQLLDFCIQDAGWHFRNEQPIVEDFLQHIDHPYKAVREAMSRTLASIFRTRHHESFMDVDSLLEANKKSSSIGLKPYQSSEQVATMYREVFARLEKWRLERTPGQQTVSSYTSGSKTVMLWLDSTLSSCECTELLDLFPDVFMEQLLHMMDIKEDPELQRQAYHVYRHLPNIPMRAGEDSAFISALIRIGKNSASWHQRLRTLINMQVIYFRRIFLLRAAEQEALLAAVADMLEDNQLEVRMGASTTLAGMIRCSPIVLRNNMLISLRARFYKALRNNKLPKKVPGTSTPTSSQDKQVIRRHAAVLGLGALVQAFPYQTPPPEWVPEILATLARTSAGDPGAIGKSVKTILADFKKTRQDTWVTDQKHFTLEQLEDLEGVNWKSYFA